MKHALCSGNNCTKSRGFSVISMKDGRKKSNYLLLWFEWKARSLKHHIHIRVLTLYFQTLKSTFLLLFFCLKTHFKTKKNRCIETEAILIGSSSNTLAMFFDTWQIQFHFAFSCVFRKLFPTFLKFIVSNSVDLLSILNVIFSLSLLLWRLSVVPR